MPPPRPASRGSFGPLSTPHTHIKACSINVTRHLPAISILLSRVALDSTQPGCAHMLDRIASSRCMHCRYQAPVADDSVAVDMLECDLDLD